MISKDEYDNGIFKVKYFEILNGLSAYTELKLFNRRQIKMFLDTGAGFTMIPFDYIKENTDLSICELVSKTRTPFGGISISGHRVPLVPVHLKGLYFGTCIIREFYAMVMLDCNDTSNNEFASISNISSLDKDKGLLGFDALIDSTIEIHEDIVIVRNLDISGYNRRFVEKCNKYKSDIIDINCVDVKSNEGTQSKATSLSRLANLGRK